MFSLLLKDLISDFIFALILHEPQKNEIYFLNVFSDVRRWDMVMLDFVKQIPIAKRILRHTDASVAYFQSHSNPNF